MAKGKPIGELLSPVAAAAPAAPAQAGKKAEGWAVTTLRFDQETFKSIKKSAIDFDVSLQVMFEHALALYLKSKNKPIGMLKLRSE